MKSLNLQLGQKLSNPRRSGEAVIVFVSEDGHSASARIESGTGLRVGGLIHISSLDGFPVGWQA